MPACLFLSNLSWNSFFSKSVVYESDLPGYSQYELEDNILIDLYDGIGSSYVEIEEQFHGLTEMYRPACEYELFVIGDTIRIQTVLTEHYINRNY